MSIVSLPLPVQLINGNVADGGQVMTDLNAIASNVNSNAAKNGVNSDITQLTALTAINSSLTAAGWSLTNPVINGGTMSGTALDGTVTGVTQPIGTNTNQLATYAALVQAAFLSSLPGQSSSTVGLFPQSQGASGVVNWAPAFPDFILKSQGII